MSFRSSIFTRAALQQVVEHDWAISMVDLERLPDACNGDPDDLYSQQDMARAINVASETLYPVNELEEKSTMSLPLSTLHRIFLRRGVDEALCVMRDTRNRVVLDDCYTRENTDPNIN